MLASTLNYASFKYHWPNIIFVLVTPPVPQSFQLVHSVCSHNPFNAVLELIF